MKRFLAIGAIALLTVALLTTPAEAGKKYSKVKGHVIQVEERVRTANGGEFDRLTIRTRNGEEMRLHLGQGGACEGCYQVGDRVRARVHAGDSSGGARGVESIRVRRGGEMRGYVNADGRMVPQRSSRSGGGAGNGDRLRDRQHEPGSGGCPGCGSGQRGGGGRRPGGGGGRGGGGR